MCEDEVLERKVLKTDCFILSTCPFFVLYFGSYGGRQGTPLNELPTPPRPGGEFGPFPHV